MSLDVPVMLMLLGAAAAMQTLLPPLPAGGFKLPLLAAVACYYAVSRPIMMALVAAVWAGILTDALGGLPPGTSAWALLVLVLVIVGVRQMAPEASWGLAAAAGAVSAPLLAITQRLMLARRGLIPALDLPLFIAIGLLIPAGALAAGCVWRTGRLLDLWAGNIAPRKEVETRDG